MQHRRFGRLGWEVSCIGVGTWAMGSNWGPQADDDSVRALHAALDAGCNFIDTARAYGEGRAERVIARALKEKNHPEVYLATKVPPIVEPGWLATPYQSWQEKFPERHIRDAVDQSLRDLGVECLDLVQIHTWSRAWNEEPAPLQVLADLRQRGKLRGIGVSTPEVDQHAVVDLMRQGLLDSVQVIYNIFEQEAQAQLFPTAAAHDVAVIVRVALDEGALTGKFTCDTTFADGDIRNSYFQGDRLARTVQRVEAVRQTVGDREPDLATAALKFALKPEVVSSVIVGVRNAHQAQRNSAVGGMAPMSDELERDLRAHHWRRAFWHAGK